MNDTAIKNFCIWARRELMEQVRIQAARFGIREDGYDPATADAIEGRLLTAQEKRQRADLVRRLGPSAAPGYAEAYEKLVDQAAYTWFNRLVAIRYMELNDRLPSHVRVLSAEDGSFRPQVIREALDVEIEGLDTSEVSALVAASDDEALFRCLILAQCRELAVCLPDVFEPVGAAMELLLPEHLLRVGSVVDRLVTDIHEDDWRQGVEIVGWMYQYYVSERKDEVFASFKKGKKAEADAIAPATQLFTPDWIVQYLTQNSLGRLWLQSHPESSLADQMAYFIPDELGAEEGETAEAIAPAAAEPSVPRAPESLRVVDPACGSGHILVYAFRLLAAMYEESGHARRDIPRLILANNLTGLEIDPRAAAMASFALSMEACELDRRYLRREERANPRIVCLRPAEIAEEELAELPMLAARGKLLDAMAHMGECGSLFVPEPADLEALRAAENELDARAAGGDLLAAAPLEQVSAMLANCEPLAETYDCVIANPPYMGSSNMDKWLAAWTKKHYSDSKRDLCTCFIERGFSLAKPDGYSAMITMQSWMFLGSFEALREKMLKERSIASMAHLGTRAFGSIGGEVVATTATVYCNAPSEEPASYLRLVDFEGEEPKEQAIREAVANPTCGWFYRRPAKAFKSIPGTPIAYWASEAMICAFCNMESLNAVAFVLQGLATGDNDRFLRLWWETCENVLHRFGLCESAEESCTWYPCDKGGERRKWYGNLEWVINWRSDGQEIRSFPGAVIRNPTFYLKEGLTWGMISSGSFSMRYVPSGSIFTNAGLRVAHKEDIGVSLFLILGAMNSSVVQEALSFIAPTMNYTNGDVGKVPIPRSNNESRIESAVEKLIDLSRRDYDAFETSWDYRRSPLVGGPE
ncbi:BREX-1 system adenine-specific DNA-methyltransferase PglX [uncultured Adlercreutzia sp.]|uniref:BREX-1 system adenine-specific DNA-methyltransferase PglX n=2 Tax=uncultured Adlercreutzia sp. TaxID=875803 RepID=UPI00262AAE24|nr:BREX-1 system adenine-specific DNA-methyltransferase PglX [uncultured Adlercreutzia sp.]MCI9261626.1 BREX-1 system adenine-specific DNA-methyltransferase PglX [Eggerthellaceae bacterium]